MFQNLTKTRAFLMLACLVAMAVIWLTGCTTTKDLQKRSDTFTARADSARETKTATKTHTLADYDSTGQTRATERATEAATNETIEEATVVTYDAATGRETSVTRTRRRSTGTAAKSSESTSATTANVSSNTDTKTDASVTDAITTHSELKRETKEKAVVKKTEPAVRAWLVGGAIAAATLSVVWAAIPSLSGFLGGGPVWWLAGFFRRKKEQSAA